MVTLKSFEKGEMKISIDIIYGNNTINLLFNGVFFETLCNRMMISSPFRSYKYGECMGHTVIPQGTGLISEGAL